MIPNLQDRTDFSLHYNYDLQTWIKDGRVLDCNHQKCWDKTIIRPSHIPFGEPERVFKIGVCNQHKYANDAEYIAIHKWEVSRGRSFPKGA